MTPPSILHHKNDYSDLLCDEVWDMMTPVMPSSSSSSSVNHHHLITHDHDQTHDINNIHPITTQDYQHSFDTYLKKETKYMTAGSGYVNLLQSNNFLANCRLKAIHWFIHSRKRFNFVIETVFNAVNYIDRFIDNDRCHGWSDWTMELVSLACLLIAIKFGETCPPSIVHEIQEGLEYSFEARLIQRMEMKILKSLNWELNSITPYSYLELITWELNSNLKRPNFVLDELCSRINDVLMASALDVKLLVYRPSVITMSALRCVLKDQDCLSHITSFIPQAQEKNLQLCYTMMQDMLVKSHEAIGNPSSPDSVLTKEQVVICEEQVDLSLIDGPLIKKDLKRMKEQDDDYECVVKHKKYIM